MLCAPSLRRRELRHGADRGVRRRHAGGRLRHRRLPRRGARRRRRRARARRPTRRRWPRRCATSTRSPSAAREMARAAAADVERFAWPRVADRGDGGLRGRDRHARSRQARCSAPPSRSASASADLKPHVPRAQAAQPRAERRPRSAPAPWRPLRRGGAGARSRSAALRARAAGAAARSGWATSPPRCCAPARRSCCSASASCAARWSLRAFSWHAILRAALPKRARQARPTRCRARSSAC